MVRIISLLCVLMLPGCSILSGQDPINTTNQLIANSNTARLAAYADGMASCGDNAACQVGISMAFATGAGQQPLFKPETAVDYLRAGLPYADLALRAYSIWGGSNGISGDRSSIFVKGDGNSFNIANRMSATDQSSVAVDWSNTFSRSTATTSGAGPATVQPYEVRPEVVSPEVVVVP